MYCEKLDQELKNLRSGSGPDVIISLKQYGCPDLYPDFEARAQLSRDCGIIASATVGMFAIQGEPDELRKVADLIAKAAKKGDELLREAA